MAQKVSTESFRSVFKAVDKDLLRWFPGHMNRGLKQMQTKLKQVDCVVEVHDARIPISGRNDEFKYTIRGIKPHILVLNKVDLISRKYIEPIRNRLKDEYEHVVFTNSKDNHCKGVANLFPLAQDLINNSDRFNRSMEEDCNLMIIGVPNVGKSSLINALRVKYLRKGNATPVGAVPGITKSVLHKIKLCDDPKYYMLDTPGILTPTISNIDIGLKLALCATIQDHQVGETVLSDYLLFWLNKHEHFKYVKYFKLERPTDNILEVLSHISKISNKHLRVRNNLNQYELKPDFNCAAQIMLRSFREGLLGRYILDEDLL